MKRIELPCGMKKGKTIIAFLTNTTNILIEDSEYNDPGKSRLYCDNNINGWKIDLLPAELAEKIEQLFK